MSDKENTPNEKGFAVKNWSNVEVTAQDVVDDKHVEIMFKNKETGLSRYFVANKEHMFRSFLKIKELD